MVENRNGFSKDLDAFILCFIFGLKGSYCDIYMSPGVVSKVVCSGGRLAKSWREFQGYHVPQLTPHRLIRDLIELLNPVMNCRRTLLYDGLGFLYRHHSPFSQSYIGLLRSCPLAKEKSSIACDWPGSCLGISVTLSTFYFWM